MSGADEWFDRTLAAGGIPDKDVPGVAQALIDSRLSFEPDKAAAWVEAHLDQPMLANDDIVTATARAWAARDPAAAVEWAARNELKAGIYPSFNQWCTRDFAAATAWLEENGANPVHSHAAYLGARFIVGKDPAEATRIANTIENPQLKEEIFRVIAAVQQQQQKNQTGDAAPSR